MKTIWLGIGMAAAALFGAPANAQSAEFLKKFKDWSAYRNAADGTAFCFSVSQPRDTEPKGLTRGEVYFYVSQYPADKVQNEISIKLGYIAKPGVNVVVTVGADTFNFFSKDDKAFIEKPDVERKFVEAMKKADKMVVRAKSVKGTDTTDVFSLQGAGPAAQLATDSCKG